MLREVCTEIGTANFNGVLWTFKQQLALKCECVVKFILVSYKRICTIYFGIKNQFENVEAFFNNEHVRKRGMQAKCKLQIPQN